MHMSEIWHSKKNDCRLSRTQVVKCYSTIFPHDKYQRNAVKFAFEKILELID